MHYLVFDLVAVLLPALLLLSTRRDVRLLLPTGALAVLALLWTAPWDEHLVRTGVWSYAPHHVLATAGAVPLEEYAFVALEVVLVAAWSLRSGLLAPAPILRATPTTGHRRTGTTAWLAVAAVGGLCLLAGGQLRYLGLLLAWACPVLALQRAVGGDVLAGRRQARLRTVAPVALWLCLADRLALGLGIWTISPRSSTGLLLAGLPLEEATFFALTTLLVTDGLLLATDPVALGRVARWLRPRAPAALVRAATPAR